MTTHRNLGLRSFLLFLITRREFFLPHLFFYSFPFELSIGFPFPSVAQSAAGSRGDVSLSACVAFCGSLRGCFLPETYLGGMGSEQAQGGKWAQEFHDIPWVQVLSVCILGGWHLVTLGILRLHGFFQWFPWRWREMGCRYTSAQSLEKATFGVRQLNRLGGSVAVFFLSIVWLICKKKNKYYNVVD